LNLQKNKKTKVVFMIICLFTFSSCRDQARGFNNRGLFAMERGDLKLAIAKFDQALMFWPWDYKVLNNRGLAKYYSGDCNSAIVDYNSAIEKNDEFYVAYNNRGLAKLCISDTLGAIEDFSKAIELNPNDGMAFRNRGKAKISLGISDGNQDLLKANDLGVSTDDEIKRFN
jgi:tetratricopeptide (TPR) repeat protein